MAKIKEKQQTWIVKAGSSLITNHGKGLDQAFIESWVEQVVALKAKGFNAYWFHLALLLRV